MAGLKFSVIVLVLTFVALRTPSKAIAQGTATTGIPAESRLVEAAAHRDQPVEEAPADVSIITAQDIRNHGYRTLGEALSSVRGFYMSYDRIYHSVGVAGISLPGDFNTRFLVLINDHEMTEHVYGSNNLFGQDFGLDMDLVERIEIVRGAGSAIYGSNAMLATINIVTRSPADSHGLTVSSETGSHGEKKASFSESVALGRGANLLISGSYFDTTGQVFSIPQFGSSTASPDGEQGYHSFATLTWGDWTLTAYFNTRRKRVPVGWADDTIFNDGGSRARDGRNFAELSRVRHFGKKGELTWKLAYDDYRYDDRFDYAAVPAQGLPVQDRRTLSRAEWLSSEATWTVADSKRGSLILGFENQKELRNLQQEFTASPSHSMLVSLNVPDRELGAFAQQEWRFSSRWKAWAGVRYDRSSDFGHTLSPGAALVWQRSPSTVIKAVYGRPFRNPSAFEKYFSDNTTVTANPNLRAERAHSASLSVEKKLRPGLTATVSEHEFWIDGLIQEVFPDDSAPQYRNVRRARSRGTEAEITAKLPQELEIAASATLQRTENLDGGQPFPNSPSLLGKLRIGAPAFGRRVFVSSAVQTMSSRLTVAGETLPGVTLQDLTFSTVHPVISGFGIQAGIRNLWNTRYDDPAGLTVDTLRQDGRTAWVKLFWQGPR